MFRSFFGIEENPFANTPDPRFVFMSKRHQEALAHLIYGVQVGSGFVLLTGEVGTGKTTISRCLVERLPETVDLALCVNPRLNELDLLANICDEMGISYPKTTDSLKVLMDAINNRLLDTYAGGRRAVLIIDEAQNLSPEVLEQVRLLTNLETASAKLLQIILIGQPELKSLLERQELRQVNQRITARCHLDPMTPDETKAYIAHRLKIAGVTETVFGSDAISEIFVRSRGVPRLINSICERCMLGAYSVGSKNVDGKIARFAAKEVLGAARFSIGKLAASIAFLLAVVAVFLGVDPLNIRGGGAEPLQPPAQDAAKHSKAETVYKAEPVSAPPPDIVNASAPTLATTIEELFQNPDMARDLGSALSRLFAMWNVQRGTLGGLDACTDVKYVGLRCLQKYGDWDSLYEINRPALINLVTSKGEQIYVVVSALNGNNVTLDVGEGQIVADIRNITPFWSGDYMVFWRPPSVHWRDLQYGMQGDDVAWIRRSLAEIQGVNTESMEPENFDYALKERVMAFQSSRRIDNNGYVGAVTFIHINTLVGDGVIPVLRKP